MGAFVLGTISSQSGKRSEISGYNLRYYTVANKSSLK